MILHEKLSWFSVFCHVIIIEYYGCSLVSSAYSLIESAEVHDTRMKKLCVKLAATFQYGYVHKCKRRRDCMRSHGVVASIKV